jgi:hypothetical protein
MDPDKDTGFLARWGRRKAQARAGELPPDPPVPLPVLSAQPVQPLADQPAAPPKAPPLTLADVAQLTHESDYSRFVAGGVDESVKRAAMKKLFSDPHFNLMDGLDTYIDDYGKPDPIPLAMLRQMNQSSMLGLFEDEDEEEAASADQALPDHASNPANETLSSSNDDPDLRLQQDDAAGRSGPDQGARA